jgi:hypothetical protein
MQQPVHAVPPQVHAPLVQACPAAHFPQALPPAPHLSDAWPMRGIQVLPSQQPFGQEAVVHSQTPVLPQICPPLH